MRTMVSNRKLSEKGHSQPPMFGGRGYRKANAEAWMA